MIITATNILAFIETEYKNNKGFIARNALGYSNEMKAAQHYLSKITPNETPLSTTQIAELINLMIPEYQILPVSFEIIRNDNIKWVRISATLVTLVKLIKKITTEQDSALTENTQEYLNIIQAYFGHCTNLFGDELSASLKKKTGYLPIKFDEMHLALNKRIEADNWIDLYNAGILTPESRKIIQQCPSAGAALIALNTQHNMLNDALAHCAKEDTRWLVAARKPVENNNQIATRWSSYEFFSESIIAGDISTCLTWLKTAGINSPDIEFLPIHLSSAEEKRYQTHLHKSTLPSPSTDHYHASNFKSALRYLKDAKILTLGNVKQLFDPKIKILFQKNTFKQLLEQIPSEERTQALWNKIVECCLDSQATSALYSTIMPLLTEKNPLSSYDSYQQRDDWFYGKEKESKTTIIQTLTLAGINIELNSTNRQLLHSRMLLWQKLNACSRTENLSVLLKFINSCTAGDPPTSRLTQECFETVLAPQRDFILASIDLNKLIKQLNSYKLETWDSILRYCQHNLFERGTANLLQLFNLMQLGGFQSFFRFLLIPENDALLCSIALQNMLKAPWLKECLNQIPAHQYTQEIWNALLRCSQLDNPEAGVRAIVVMHGQLPNDANNQQSVHLVSVHESVANSLYRLYARYYNPTIVKKPGEKIQEQIAELDYFHAMLKIIYKAVEINRLNPESNFMSIDRCIKKTDELKKLNNVENNDEIENLQNTISVFFNALKVQCLTTIFPELPNNSPIIQRTKQAGLIEKFNGILIELLQSLGEGKFDFKDWGSAGKIDSAARCLTRLRSLTIHEEITQYPIKKILALVWEGILDKEVHTKDKTEIIDGKEVLFQAPNALEHLINELFNMQDREGIKNNAACGAGSLNDTLNPLNSVHPDVVLVMVDEPNVIRIVQEEAHKIAALEIEKITTKNDTFLNELNAASPNTDSYAQMLLAIKTQATARIDKNLGDAKFTPEQIRRIKDGDGKTDERKWLGYDYGVDYAIKKGLKYFTNNQYAYLRGFIKNKYLEKYPPEEIENNQNETSEENAPSDDFESLIQVIKNAKKATEAFLKPKAKITPQEEEKSDDEDSEKTEKVSAETWLATAGKVTGTRTKNSFFQAAIPDALIDNLLTTLKNKDSAAVVNWLRENATELSKGIFGRKLKDYFFDDADTTAKKPFNCTDLAELADCIEQYGKQQTQDNNASCTVALTL